MSRKRLELGFYLLSVLLFLLLLDNYYTLRQKYYDEYLKHREVMLLLKNYQSRQKVNVDENFARQKLLQFGADLISFKQTDSGYEIRAKNLRGENLPRLVYEIESAGVEVVKLSATDNTGQGIYELQVVIR